MFAFLERYFTNRRLKPVVAALPRRLAKAFGPAKSYTFAQTRRVVGELKISQRAVPYAFVAACSLEELARNGAGLGAEEYRRMRAELAELFALPSADFTIENLLSKS